MVLVSLKAGAQYDPYFTHYFDMQTSVNPAAAGKEAKLNINAVYAMTMVGFENSPKTIYISADMPFIMMKTRQGVGFQLVSDNLGLFSHMRIEGQYAIWKKLWGGRFAAGVQMGLVTEKFKGSEVDLAETTDDVFTKSDVDGKTFDVGLGFYYTRKQWWAAVSAQHLTSPTVSLGETNQFKIDPMLYAMGGYDFQMNNPLWKISTSAIVRSDLSTYRADLTGRVLYNYEGRQFYAGVAYSPQNSATILLGGQFQGVMIGYSYEIYTNGISLKNGGHEIFLGYQMDVNLGKKGKNYHQTTRTL